MASSSFVIRLMFDPQVYSAARKTRCPSAENCARSQPEQPSRVTVRCSPVASIRSRVTTLPPATVATSTPALAGVGMTQTSGVLDVSPATLAGPDTGSQHPSHACQRGSVCDDDAGACCARTLTEAASKRRAASAAPAPARAALPPRNPATLQRNAFMASSQNLTPTPTVTASPDRSTEFGPTKSLPSSDLAHVYCARPVRM